MSINGKFIAIEGIDGSGKTSLVKAICEMFPEFKYTRMPGGSEFSESIREITRNAEISEHVQTLLYSANILDCMEKVVKPALDCGKSVISDRCYLSTYAYQAAGNPSEKVLAELLKSGLTVKPDLLIYLDLPIKAALEREAGQDRVDVTDRYSRYTLERKQQIYDNYMSIVNNATTVSHSMIRQNVAKRIVTINASLSLKDVASLAKTAILNNL